MCALNTRSRGASKTRVTTISCTPGFAVRSSPRTAVSPTPRHSARATRAAGQSMRSRLLDAASALFKARGLNGTSITAIANASDAFPSQITYYFRSKEALFVEAACRDILHIAERAEKAAARARTPKAYARALTDSVTGADGLVLFVEALILTRQRPDLVPEIARTIERLAGHDTSGAIGSARDGASPLADTSYLGCRCPQVLDHCARHSARGSRHGPERGGDVAGNARGVG